MAGSINKAILVGRLGKDPEVVSLNDGNKIVKFSVATSETWNDKSSGERRERTEWHNVVIFNEHLGRIAEQYLRKGNQVYLEGQLQTRKWQGKDGNDRYTTEVVLQRYRGELTLLGGRGDTGGGDRVEGNSGGDTPASDSPGGGEASGGGGSPAPAKPPKGNDMDDDIPF